MKETKVSPLISQILHQMVDDQASLVQKKLLVQFASQNSTGSTENSYKNRKMISQRNKRRVKSNNSRIYSSTYFNKFEDIPSQRNLNIDPLHQTRMKDTEIIQDFRWFNSLFGETHRLGRHRGRIVHCTGFESYLLYAPSFYREMPILTIALSVKAENIQSLQSQVIFSRQIQRIRHPPVKDYLEIFLYNRQFLLRYQLGTIRAKTEIIGSAKENQWQRVFLVFLRNKILSSMDGSSFKEFTLNDEKIQHQQFFTYLGSHNGTICGLRIAEVFINYQQLTFSQKEINSKHVLAVNNVQFEDDQQSAGIRDFVFTGEIYSKIECGMPNYINRITNMKIIMPRNNASENDDGNNHILVYVPLKSFKTGGWAIMLQNGQVKYCDNIYQPQSCVQINYKIFNQNSILSLSLTWIRIKGINKLEILYEKNSGSKVKISVMVRLNSPSCHRFLYIGGAPRRYLKQLKGDQETRGYIGVISQIQINDDYILNLKKYPPQNEHSISNLLLSYASGTLSVTPKLLLVPVERGKSKSIYCGYSQLFNQSLTRNLRISPLWCDYKGHKKREDLDSDFQSFTRMTVHKEDIYACSFHIEGLGHFTGVVFGVYYTNRDEALQYRDRTPSITIRGTALCTKSNDLACTVPRPAKSETGQDQNQDRFEAKNFVNVKGYIDKIQKIIDKYSPEEIIKAGIDNALILREKMVEMYANREVDWMWMGVYILIYVYVFLVYLLVILIPRMTANQTVINISNYIIGYLFINREFRVVRKLLKMKLEDRPKKYQIRLSSSVVTSDFPTDSMLTMTTNQRTLQ